ncbi:MAG: BA14K family protein [Xanthobacteraceae bacterium]|jgi:hypothetical protein
MTRLNNIRSSRPLFAQAGHARALGLICGSIAFVLASAMPLATAFAYTPDSLRRLDPPQPGQITEGERNTRGAYARMGDEDITAARLICVQQFKSYDQRSGTYLGHDGRRHPCP